MNNFYRIKFLGLIFELKKHSKLISGKNEKWYFKVYKNKF